MPEIELKTAKFFEQQNELHTEPSAASAGDASDEPSVASSSKTAAWEKTAGWIGVGAMGLVVMCLALIVVPKITGIKQPKAASPIDWWLWLGGAKSDQTFEKFVRDTATKNQVDWDAKYRESPMYQFKGVQPIDINKMQGIQQFNGQMQPRR